MRMLTRVGIGILVLKDIHYLKAIANFIVKT